MDRVHGMRPDEQWIADQLRDPRTRFVPVWRAQHLCTEQDVPRPVLLSCAETEGLRSEPESMTLLGQREHRCYFALGLPSKDGLLPDQLRHLGRFRDLREVAARMSRQDGALLAQARAFTHWHRRHRFCGDCGSPTSSAEGGHLRVCTDGECGRQVFPRTDPAIIVLVTAGERCLLGRQSVWPEGMYSTIAGFVEPGESAEDAVVREVREETGVSIREIYYHSSQPWPFPGSLMLGFRAQAVGEEIRPDHDELEDARWFSRLELQRGLQSGQFRLPSPISIAYRLIEDWYDSGNCGPLADLSVA